MLAAPERTTSDALASTPRTIEAPPERQARKPRPRPADERGAAPPGRRRHAELRMGWFRRTPPYDRSRLLAQAQRARSRGRRMVILHRHPLRTSDRKARLYSKREHFAFMLKTLLLGGRNLRDRGACGVWYDGRR